MTMKKMNKIERILYTVLHNHGCENCSVLIAFSGGPDSMSLIIAARNIKKRLNLKIHACWINHGLRPREEMADEFEIVNQTCTNLEIPLKIIESGPGYIKSMAAMNKAGIESAARDFRHSALKNAAMEFGDKYILTAHTADDQLETIIMRIFRGSGSAGLTGIHETRDNFIHPFLQIPKKFLLEYLSKNGVKWSIDSTNQKCDFLRNKIRKELIPVIENIFPGYASGLKNLSEKSEIDEMTLKSISDSQMKIQYGKDSLSCDLKNFEAALPGIRFRVLQKMCELSKIKELNFKSVKPILKGKVDGKLPLSGKEYIIKKDERNLFFERIKLHAKIHDSSGFYLEYLSPEEILSRQKNTLLPQEKKLPYVFWNDKPIFNTGIGEFCLKFPIIIRQRKHGDVINLHSGKKHVDRILMDLHIPGKIRDSVPIIQDCNGIVAVLSSLTGYYDFVRYDSMLDNHRSTRYLIVQLI